MDNRSLLEKFLPTEPAQTELIPHLSLHNLSRLARTSKNLHGFFQDTLTIEQLAHYIIIEPNVVEVIKIIKAHPYLLDTNIPKVINRKGQLIQDNKPFSLAFGAGDDEMCAALKEEMLCFYGAEAAETEIQKQVSEKIGAENKEIDDQIKNQLGTLLQSVTQAISNEPFPPQRDHDNKLTISPATLAAILTFREGFSALQPKVINKGMHFRSNTLQETYHAYDRAAAQWRYEYNPCALFEDGVLSFVLAYLPENDAQRCSQGLFYLQQEYQSETFVRSLKLRRTNIDFYDHLNAASSDFSGLSGSCIDIVFAQTSTLAMRMQTSVATRYQTLCQTKSSNLQSLCSRNDLQIQRPTM